jgi:AcrR family transcriptional regulator
MLGSLMPRKKTKLSPRKLEIIQEAQQMFSRDGYQDASMRELAEALNIRAASLYSHFSSKEEMLWLIAKRCAAEFDSAIQPIYLDADLTPAVKIKKMLIAHLDVVIRNLDASAIFSKEWKHLNEPRLSEFRSLRDQYEDKFMEVVSQGVEKKDFKPVNPRFTTLSLLSSVNWIPKWYNPAGNMSPADIGEQLSLLFLDGLYHQDYRTS